MEYEFLDELDEFNPEKEYLPIANAEGRFGTVSFITTTGSTPALKYFFEKKREDNGN